MSTEQRVALSCAAVALAVSGVAALATLSAHDGELSGLVRMSAERADRLARPRSRSRLLVRGYRRALRRRLLLRDRHGPDRPWRGSHAHRPCGVSLRACRLRVAGVARQRRRTSVRCAGGPPDRRAYRCRRRVVRLEPARARDGMAGMGRTHRRILTGGDLRGHGGHERAGGVRRRRVRVAGVAPPTTACPPRSL